MRRRLFVVVLPIALGCRGVLGIDPLPPLPDDAGGAVDAGVDSPTQTYCDTVSPPAQLCSDFDRGGAVGAGWENGTQEPNPGEQGGGQISLDEGLFKSAPGSAAMTTPALPGAGTHAAAILLAQLARPVRKISLSFDIYVSQEDFATGGFAIIASIDFGSGGVLVVRDQLGVGFSTGPDSATFRLTQRIPVGQWRNVALLVVNEPTDGGPDGYVRVAVDANTAGLATLPAKVQSAGPPSVLVGASVDGPIGPFKANVDNVIVRFDER